MEENLTREPWPAWDGHVALAQHVLAVLQDAGPLDLAGIQSALDAAGHGRPHTSAINKVLHQHLSSSVESADGQVWSVVVAR